MMRRRLLALQVAAATQLLVAGPVASAQEADPFAPLAAETRPLQTRWQTDYSGQAQLGLGYTSDDNYMFGQYNGLENDGVTLIGNLNWQDYRSGDSYWQVELSDLGLATREGELTWGIADRLRIRAGYDSQQQVRNDSGRTPFSGSDTLTLPDNWESGTYTDNFTTLEEALYGFQRELNRDKLSLAVDGKLTDNWRYSGSVSYEEKEGDGDIGGAIYTSLTVGDAVLLPMPVDQASTELDLGLAYSDERLHLDGRVAWSDFDNDEDLLSWQNPYSSFGPRVRYPEGYGGLALAPDNEQLSGRLTGHYIFSAKTRLQFDGSYALATQDQSFADYTVNPALVVTEPVPTSDLDGEVANSTLNTRLLFQPLDRVNAEVFYKLRDRDYDVDRNGYLYVRGDATDQPDSPLTVYNTAHGLTEQTLGFEADYRLPGRWRKFGRISFGYAYEEIERENAAVEETEEDRFTLGWRVRPTSKLNLRLGLEYADRAADTYEWDQSYYALLDTELINATPDSQRYTNHPQLFQYYMANREGWEASVDANYLLSTRWNLNANIKWRDDDYDQSRLGLTGTTWLRSHISATYMHSAELSTSVYAGYDQYEADQSSRTFMGGQEKNAFEIYPPLPQASDPNQDWDLETTDGSFTLGASVDWRPAPDWQFSADYSFVDTSSEQDFSTRPGGSVVASDLPDVDTTLHHLSATGAWHLREDLSVQLDYQFYSYESDDWAWDKVQANTVGKVLTFGQDNPDEDVHYLGASVIYRWK